MSDVTIPDTIEGRHAAGHHRNTRVVGCPRCTETTALSAGELDAMKVLQAHDDGHHQTAPSAICGKCRRAIEQAAANQPALDVNRLQSLLACLGIEIPTYERERVNNAANRAGASGQRKAYLMARNSHINDLIELRERMIRELRAAGVTLPGEE